jgi:type IV pilus assembly protein PilB
VSTQAIKTLSLDRELPPDTVSEAMEPIAGLLVKSGFLTPEQLRYGRRIQGKLASPKPLLRVLEDLRYVTRDQIQRALQASEVRIPLGALLLELGLIRESDLKSALETHPESPMATALSRFGGPNARY